MMPRSLKFRIALYLAAGLAVVVALYTAFMVRQQRQDLLDVAIAYVMQLSDTIIRSTHFMMLENQPYYVHRLLQDVGRDRNIDRVRIFSKKGVVIDSTLASEIGFQLDRKAQGCVSCHLTEEARERVSDADRARIFAREDRRFVGVMQAIRNEPSCEGAGCHAPVAQQPILGVVDIVYSLEEFDRKVRASMIRIGELSLAFVALAAACVSLLVNRFVHRPLSDLESGAKRLAAGNLDEAIPVRSADEFGQVAGSFNAMTAALRESQEQLREAARTLEHKVEKRTAELRSAQAEAAQHEKLAAVGLLASGVAHEINNPLTGVLTFSHLLRERMPPGSQEAEDMDLVIGETKRCASIVRRLLDFARQKKPERKFTNLNAAIEEVARFIERPAHLHDTAVNFDLAPDLPCLWVDADQLKQVLMNLLVNAQHATEGGGSITIRSRLCPEPMAPEPGGEPVEMVEIAVVDTGCGIPAKDLKRIFEPFFTSKGVGKGTGLGLSVSHGIVKAHGGAIKVESVPGEGSTFRVFLPATAPPGESAEPGTGSAA